MKLEKQVCSLELAKKLKELGVEQDSLFKWERSCSNGLDGWNVIYSQAKEQVFSAFTVVELLEMFKENQRNKLNIFYNDNNYFVELNVYGTTPDFIFTDENLSNSIAKMLMCLIENKLI
jgi:hypothetical protein